MSLQQCIARRSESAAEFDAHENRNDGMRVASSLIDGLDTLRSTLFTRIHVDVERHYGSDSMLSPISLKDMQKMEATSRVEIEIYQVAVSVEEARDRGFVTDIAWYRDWLSQLRLGELTEKPRVTARLEHYLEEARGERRLEFSSVLTRVVPEAAKAPLVLYRLFPYAVRIATDLAFGDPLAASEARKQKVMVLPPIADCRDCHGRPLDNGEHCPQCGNPLWRFNWLRADD